MNAITRVDFVLLLLTDSDGRFLLQHRDESAPTYGGYWGFFGGAMEEGETPAEALWREAFEELRYVPTHFTPKLVLAYEDNTYGRAGTKYYFSEPCADKTRLHLHEGQGMDWFLPGETRDLKMHFENRAVLEKLAEITS